MTQITAADLTNAKSDVDTIANIANSTSTSVTDRLGHTRRTLYSLANEFPNASDNAAAAAASAVSASLDAIAAESARDAALIQSGVYETEALGRAAVADGQAFKVQGSGDIAAYEYRRVNAGTSTLIATYPSSDLVSWIAPLSGVLSKNTTGVGGYLRAFTDKYGRLFAGIRSTGTVYVGSLQTKTATLTTATINALTISTSRVFGVLTATLNSNVSGVLSAVTDKYGQIGRASCRERV